MNIPSRRVLITGATGLLGRAVYKEFQQSNWHTVGCGFRRARPKFEQVNLLDSEAVHHLIHDFQVWACMSAVVMCSLRTCLAYTESVCLVWLREVVLESCDPLSHHNAECPCVACCGVVLGVEARGSRACWQVFCPRAGSSSLSSTACGEAWLVLMQYFPCDACREVLGCCLGTGWGLGGGGNISALMLRKYDQGNFSNLFAVT